MSRVSGGWIGDGLFKSDALRGAVGPLELGPWLFCVPQKSSRLLPRSGCTQQTRGQRRGISRNAPPWGRWAMNGMRRRRYPRCVCSVAPVVANKGAKPQRPHAEHRKPRVSSGMPVWHGMLGGRVRRSESWKTHCVSPLKRKRTRVPSDRLRGDRDRHNGGGAGHRGALGVLLLSCVSTWSTPLR